MNTGTCFLPSCTAMVWPTISGKIVEARDHVRSIFLLLAELRASMRFISRSSTHGPFLLERLISYLLFQGYASHGHAWQAGQGRSERGVLGTRASEDADPAPTCVFVATHLLLPFPRRRP